jgi:hypothetical protein
VGDAPAACTSQQTEWYVEKKLCQSLERLDMKHLHLVNETEMSNLPRKISLKLVTTSFLAYSTLYQSEAQ